MNNLKKNFWSKILVGISILAFFVSPFSGNMKKQYTAAQTQAANFNNIQGSGSWSYANNIGSFTGQTTNYPDGNYAGNITTAIPSGSAGTPPTIIIVGAWSGQVTSGNISGSFNWTNVNSQNPWFGLDNGTWLGTTAFNQTSFDPGINAGTGIPGTYNKMPEKNDLHFGCWYLAPFLTPGKCATQLVFEVIFTPISYLTTLAAKFLDFFVYYSISSDAYRSGFVEKAWSVVRDISNMLFIIALLYIAVKTILQMNTSNQQRALGYIIMIALVINFSLFISRVVIDASNILARVFYNNITPYDEHGNAIPPESNKPKSVSVGLVRTFEPQRVISDPSIRPGEFFIVTIIFIILLVYMILMFISMSMLFLGRVAGLWMAMMFSPIAFASVAMPFPIPKFSFGEWRKELFRLAFMAPIFAFFLYIIILFGGFLSEIQYDVSNTADSLTGWLDALMKNIIPFILIFVLLKEAKAITKEYAGKMGEAFNNAGSMVGGLALGAATGVTAIAGRRLLGRAGAYVARNASKDNAIGRTVGRIGKRMSTASWDLRQAKIPIINKGLSDTGLKNLNTITPPKTGGYQKFREDLKQKRLKRAEEISKVEYGEGVSKNLRKVELDLHTLLDENKSELESLDKKIAGARQNLQDARAADDGSADSKDKIARYNEQIKAFKTHQTAIKKGEKINIQYLDYDDSGQVIIKQIDKDYTGLKAGGKSIQELESEVIPAAKKAIRDKEKKRKLAYADRLSRVFWSDGHKEVAHKIRSGATYENKT